MAAEPSTTSLGSYLRSLREAKGSSLEDMARSTRVGLRHLEALEAERLADLPSPVFVRGFIRAYCTFLREGPDEALGRYEALVGQRAAALAASVPPKPRNTWASSSVLVGLALLVILGVALIIINLTVKRQGGTSIAAPNIERPAEQAPAPSAPPVPVAPPAVSAPAAPQPPAPATTAPVETARHSASPTSTVPAGQAAPAAQAPSVPAPALASPAPVAAKASPGAQRLVIRAVESSWIRVQPDDGRATEETLPPGAIREWSAERRFLVTVGNAGGVELTLNGKVLPPLGPKGAVIHRLELPQASASGS